MIDITCLDRALISCIFSWTANTTHLICIEDILSGLNATSGTVPLFGLGVLGTNEQMESVFDI